MAKLIPLHLIIVSILLVFLAPNICLPAEEVDRDGRFIAYSNGTVLDSKTGLEWIVGPDKKTTWSEAKSWVENFTVAGGGWRMPTREEIKTLFIEGAGTQNMTPLLKTNGWWVWSGETKGSSSAWGFDFSHGDAGGDEGWGNRDHSNGARGFAVRSRK
jgi:hypothetical protein